MNLAEMIRDLAEMENERDACGDPSQAGNHAKAIAEQRSMILAFAIEQNAAYAR